MEHVAKQIVDLKNSDDAKEVLLAFGEAFEFGGPDGNVSAIKNVDDKGWGVNWNAFNDCLRYLEDGGIWLTSKKFPMPLEIQIINFHNFEKHDPSGFQIMKDILSGHEKEYGQKGKHLKVTYN